MSSCRPSWSTSPTSPLPCAAPTVVLIVVPSHAFASMLEDIAPWLEPGARIAWATKGFEPGTGRFLHELVAERLPGRAAAVVTGPSFAREVAAGMPSAVTVHSDDDAFAHELALLLHAPNFRAYSGSDVLGAELGGAMKNVLAVATGVADGMELGLNARAGLITRGMNEMLRLGVALGARPETLMGLSGLGDLVLTCTGDLSRNRRLGLALGRGRALRGRSRDRPGGGKRAHRGRSGAPGRPSMGSTCRSAWRPRRAARRGHAGRRPQVVDGARAEA